MIGLYHIVKDDLFGIARRLKALDENYFVVYSYRDNRYEVHNKGNKGNTYCFFAERLDERVIEKARRTRRERLLNLIAEMERDNAAYTRKRIAETVANIETGVENALSGRTK